MDTNSIFGASPIFSLIKAIPFSYAALIPVLNPLGSAVIFMTLTFGLAQEDLNTLARRVAINTFILLVVVLLTGTWILRFFGITIPIVQVGGGLILSYIGWNLLNQPTSQPLNNDAPNPDTRNIKEMAFYPLTMPITADPGCIAVALTVGAHQMKESFEESVAGQTGAIIGVFLCAATVFICYRYANHVILRLGSSGTHIIVRLSAFINLCIGLTIIWRGLQALGVPHI